MGILLGFQPVVLWTDALLFLLVALALVSALRARAQAPLRAAWRKVGRRSFRRDLPSSSCSRWKRPSRR